MWNIISAFVWACIQHKGVFLMWNVQGTGERGRKDGQQNDEKVDEEIQRSKEEDIET